MRRLRPLVVVVGLCVFGALGTMAVGAALGMHAADLATLAAYLLPALALTVLAVALANRLLANVSLRQRFVVIAVAGTVVSLGNLFALTRAMAITQHDATLLATLLLYSAATGVGAAVSVSRSALAGLGRLSRTARRLGEGDLDARVGSLDAEPELEELARAMDEMADRLRSSQERERRAESTRNDLITAVSHDLRTPLASLRAMVEAIDEGVVRDTPTLERYAAEMRRSVGQLSAMVNDLFELVQDCERRGDQFTTDILHRLDTTFVTPFDREDIHALAEELDDVVDDIYQVAALLRVLGVKEILPELVEQAQVLVKMAKETTLLIDRLESMNDTKGLLDSIDRLESDGDAVYRRALGRLFSGEFDALDVIKWKDIVSAMEGALNTLEDIGDVVESIILKHA